MARTDGKDWNSGLLEAPDPSGLESKVAVMDRIGPGFWTGQ